MIPANSNALQLHSSVYCRFQFRHALPLYRWEGGGHIKLVIIHSTGHRLNGAGFKSFAIWVLFLCTFINSVLLLRIVFCQLHLPKPTQGQLQQFLFFSFAIYFFANCFFLPKLILLFSSNLTSHKMKPEECKGYFQISCCNCFCLRHYLIIIYAKVKVIAQLFIFVCAKKSSKYIANNL